MDKKPFASANKSKRIQQTYYLSGLVVMAPAP